VWWICSIIGLQEGFVIYIDNLTARSNIRHLVVRVEASEYSDLSGVHPSRIARIQDSDIDYNASECESNSTTETDIHNKVIDICKAFPEQSKQERKVITRFTRQNCKEVKRKTNMKKPIKTFGTQTEGIERGKLRRRKPAGECQRCAWPQDRKGSHKSFDRFLWK
jgi:hypothetical protein